MRLTKKEREIYHDCQGACRICLYEGGCKLEKKLKGGKKTNGTVNVQG